MNTPGQNVTTQDVAAQEGRAAFRMFFDSINPSEIVENARACLYFDGEPGKATADDAKRFSRVRWITRTGDYRNCGILDFEPGCPITFQIPVLQRYVLGRKGMKVRARIYTDRADAHLAWNGLRQAGLHTYPGLLWWVATLDGSQGRTPESLAAELADVWNAPIPAASLWGHQWFGGVTVDESDLFLDF